MRRALPLAVIAIMQAGCFREHWSPRGHKIAYGVDGTVAAFGVVGVLSSCPPPPDDLSCDVPPQAAGVLLLAVATIAAAINLWMAGNPPPPAPPSSEAPSLDDLAADAFAATRLGHCDQARVSMHTIFHEDRMYYDQVVAAEPALERCLR